jgi:hypothetical protein
LKFPPGAQNEIQLDEGAAPNASAPGIPVSPKQDQPGSVVCASNVLAAAVFVETIQARQGLLVGSPEEAAYNAGIISLEQLKAAVRNLGPCSYANALNLNINW